MITKHRCSNGARIVLEQIPGVRSVSIGLWIGTGSRYETREMNGVSHFLEHMFFKGTTSRNAREIAESFDRIGGYVNAFTAKEYTCLYAKVLDDHGAYALDVLADMFFHSTFAPDELAKEKGVVFEEIKMYEDTPDEMVHDLLGEASFGDHPLGYPILGSKQSVRNFNRETLRDYMAESYTPDNVVISIAGNADESIIKKAEQLFGSFQASPEKVTSTRPDFQTNKIARRKETEQAHLCLGFSGLPIGHEDIYSVMILNNILGGSMSSRLFQEIRERHGLAYAVFSYHAAFRDNGILTIYGGTGADQVELMFDKIAGILEQLKREGITSTELENSKEQMKGNMMLGLESPNSRMSRNGRNELLLRHHLSLEDILERINRVTKEQVSRMAQTIFNDHFSCSLVSPYGQLPRMLQ